MVASKMIVTNTVDTVYAARPNPPLGGVYRKYDPVADIFPTDFLSTIDACEVVDACMRLIEDNQGDYLPLALTVTGFLVNCVKSGSVEGGHPVKVMSPGYIWAPSGPWRLVQGAGTEYSMRTTLHAAYCFARVAERRPTDEFGGETAQYWSLQLLNSVRQMQKLMVTRATPPYPSQKDQAWMAGSLADCYVEASPNWATNPGIRPLYIADVMWNAFTEAIDRFGDNQTAGDGSGSYNLSQVRDDWFDWLEDVITNRDGLMSDTDPAYADLPYQVLLNQELINPTISYVGGVHSTVGATNHTLDISGIAWEPGDVAVAFLAGDDDSTPHEAPDGWEFRGWNGTGFGTDRSLSIWARTLGETASEDQTPTFSTLDYGYVMICVWRGITIELVCLGPEWVSQTGGGNLPAPPINATAAGLLVMGYFHREVAAPEPVAPVGSTTRRSAAWPLRALAIGDKLVGAAGLQTPGNWTAPSGGLGSMQFSIVFEKPVQALPEGRNILTRAEEI